MTRCLTILAAILPGLCASAVHADGLIHQLPEDGRWAKYDLTVKFGVGGKAQTASGDVRLSSVGKETVKGVPCRWIELALTLELGGMTRIEVYKMLIPEKQLKAGGDPLPAVVRAWRFTPGSEPRKLDDPASPGRPLSGMLVGPADKPEKLKPAETESKLGKLQCAGVKGRKTLSQPDGKRTVTIDATTRTHKKAPFGVVTLKIDYSYQKSKTSVEKGAMEFKLSDFGGNAKSEIPDKK